MPSYPKFTPGPWFIDRTKGDAVPEFVYDATNLGVADATRGRKRSEQLANAKLIAEAPTAVELLCEAIDWLEGDVNSIIESHCMSDDDYQPIRSTLEEAAKPDVEAMELLIKKSDEMLARLGINRETICFTRPK